MAHRTLCLQTMEEGRTCQRLEDHEGEHNWDVEYRQITMHPWGQVRKNFAKQAEAGHFVLQSWTCKGCGAVQRMSQVNGFYDVGGCENCGHDTNLKVHGCNFTLMAVVSGSKPQFREQLKEWGFKPPRDN